MDGPRSPNSAHHERIGAFQGRLVANGQSQANGHRPPASADAQAALAARWNLDNVVALLHANAFSPELQETFRQLDLHGSKFLDLGKNHAGKGPSLMYSTINPKLADISAERGHTFDPAKAREEGKRLRKLVRGIVSNGGVPTFMRPRGSTIDTPSTAESNSPGKNPPSASPALHSTSQPRPSKNSPFPPPDENANAPDMARSRSDFTASTLRNLDGPASKRHSPNGSSEVSLHSPTGIDSRAPSSLTTADTSPQLNSPKPTSTQGRYYNSSHHRGHSSEQSLNMALASIPGLSESRMSFSGPISASARIPESKRRPSIVEPHNRNPSIETQSGKEHRNIWEKLKGKRSNEPSKSSDDLAPRSPSSTSPNALREFFRGGNASDTALHRPRSDQTRLHAKSDASRKYVMLTADGWNYRLLDVSGVDSSEDFRNLVRYNLQMPVEVTDLPIFMTSPGQVDFHESLSDIHIAQCLRGADENATLKLFVRTPYRPGAASDPTTVSAMVPPPFFPIAYSGGRPVDEETLRRLDPGLVATTKDANDDQQGKEGGVQGVPVARPRDLKKAMEDYRKEVERRQQGYLDERRSQVQNDGKSGFIDFDKRRDSLNDEKRDSLVPLRQAPQPPSDSNTLLKANSLKRNPDAMRRTASERSDGSSSRKSWDTEGNEETPHRKGSCHAKPPSGAIAGALASAGKMTAAMGQPNATTSRSQPNSRPGSSRATNSRSESPRSPGFTMSKGNVPFKIPDYNNRVSMSPDEAAAAIVSYKDDNDVTKKVRESMIGSSPHTSPPARQFSRLSRSSTYRKSYGPNLEFKEHHVTFDRLTGQSNSDDSDSDSDGGLFAVPLTGQDTANGKSNNELENKEATVNERRQRPSLSVRPPRSPRAGALKSVSWGSSESRETDNDDTPRGEAPPNIRQNSNEYPDSAQPSSITPESPDETTKEFRRRSFYSDVWADRPAPETVAERLDEFFPNVDLDQPMLDPESSPPVSPNIPTRRPAPKKSHESLRSQYPLSSTDDSDNGNDSDDGKPAPSGRHSERPISVANRNLRRSGGIGRTKSIRDVVKSVYIPSYEVPPLPPPGAAGPSTHHAPEPSIASNYGHNSIRNSHVHNNRISELRKDPSMIRRRSTKMFGARIEQIKPQRGSRLVQGLETIPDSTLGAINSGALTSAAAAAAASASSSSTMKRQATFKWLKGQLIGKGTFGKVFLGFNTTTAELMAVKQVEVDTKRAGSDKDKIKEMVKALDQEIDTMQNLEHHNIVAYLGCEREELKISIFLEYIDGGSVGSCLRKHGKFEEPVVSSLTRQTLQGLSYLHDSGILHRDLKADNILLTSDGICKISDFGISKKTDNIYGNDAQNTMQGSVFWMAPEVVRSQGAGYSAKVDIWSLGCVVLEMFAGRRPWAKDEAIGAIYKLGTLNQAPPIPEDVSTHISPAALSFMFDCFTVDPRERPTAVTLLESEFSKGDQNFSFFDSELYQKIKPRD